MTKIFSLFIAGGLGTVTRYFVSGWAYHFFGSGFPFGTIATNILGSFLVGIIMPTALSTSLFSPDMRLTITFGFLGGFTTYSGFNYETIDFFTRGDYGKGTLYISVMFVACIVSGALGLMLAKRMI